MTPPGKPGKANHGLSHSRDEQGHHGTIEPTTGSLKVQVQMPEAAEEFLNLRFKQKMKRGKPCKGSQEKGPSQNAVPHAGNHPLQDPGDWDPEGDAVVLVPGRGSVLDQGSVNSLDPEPCCSN